MRGRRRWPSTSGKLPLRTRASPPKDPGSGVSFHFIVGSNEAVAEVMESAVAAGGGIVKRAEAAPYGYSGYFSDPDGYLWKVATGA